jgi:predicted dienelactone hydrolase
MHDRTSTTRALAATLALLLAVATAAAVAPPAGAETEYRRGPDPTEASITAAAGPFATTSVSVPSSVPGFGGGVIHHPTSTAQGTFGAVAIAPGFLGSSSNYAWMGPRLASQGFVVFLINTNSRFDTPPSRGDQLLAALDWLVASSPIAVRSRVDASRLAVAGHSMGGGGALEASLDRPSLQASLPLQPWHTPASFAGVQVPTMIIGAEADTTAPVASHAEPFYESLTSASDRAYLELNGADHRVSTTSSTTQAKFMIAWLKRFVDNDTRYEPFLCPPPSPSAQIEEYRHSCPGPA